MLEEQQMGSQTLEILRQGVWASLTGGWFYDPHQDVFCNTFHLYIWLFLLCLPLTIYVYFPPTWYVWYFYCGSVTLGLTILKLANYGLHHMYDTTECIQEEVEEDWRQQRKVEEGIEMQILPSGSNKSSNQPGHSGMRAVAFFPEIEGGPSHSTDAESLESTDFQQLDAAEGGPIGKPSGTIDLKAEVHRKNSSESSEEFPCTSIIETVSHRADSSEPRKMKRLSDRRKQRLKSDGLVTFSVKDEKSSHKLQLEDSPEMRQRPSLTSVECEPGGSSSHFAMVESGGRRHSNFTSMGFLTSSVQVDIKPTGSLELGYIDKNPNQSLTSEGFYFKPNVIRAPTAMGVRRIRSTVLETCCPAPSLAPHPNSLEVIGGSKASTRNPLPPPSTSLTRNQHLNLCPYYGSEIVYPIAEQSDEHQTSHGPDTDMESLARGSDSEFEDNGQGNHSPLIYMKLNKMKSVPYPTSATNVKYQHHLPKTPIEKQLMMPYPLHISQDDQERTNSKDHLIDHEEFNSLSKFFPFSNNSNSSATPDMHDARAEFYITDNDVSDRNLSCSNTSMECEEKSTEKRLSDKKRQMRKHGEEVEERGPMIIRKKQVKKNRRRGKGERSKVIGEECRRQGNFSSLMELDLDWLFEDEGHHLQHRKEPLKRDTEWSSATTVSLEHDVSKVLQETVPSTRSLGAIPKRNRATSVDQPIPSGMLKPPKSESEKCSVCRCKPISKSEDGKDGRLTKENKLTQTQTRQSESPSPVEGLECVVYSQAASKMARTGSSKKGSSNNSKNDPQIKNEEASSSGSNNELSTLLPPAPLLSAFLNSRRECPVAVYPTIAGTEIRLDRPNQNRMRLKRVSRVNRRRTVQMARKESAIAGSLSAGFGTHGAKNFNDTSDGSVHCFLDEMGNWVTYTFDERGVGTANTFLEPAVDGSNSFLVHVPVEKSSFCLRQSDPITATSSTSRTTHPVIDLWDSTESVCNRANPIILDSIGRKSHHNIPVAPEQLTRLKRTFHRNRMLLEVESEAKFKCIASDIGSKANYRRTRTYYKFRVTPWTYVKVTLDRLKLLALLDRNLTLKETVLSIFLGSLVGVLGSMILFMGFYTDLLSFIFCFVMASCQYSLLKSVQPDAASPTHGFNRVIAYSRPVYFCIFSLLILIVDSCILYETKENGYNLNAFSLTPQQMLLIFRDFLVIFILLFPVLFSLGLFPQINTFVMYILEQVDMHLFGGNAMSSLLGSFYCVFRSILAVIVLVGFAYGGLSESKGAQHILFSIFCACLVACCYHLSRSASDPSHIWNLMKSHLWLPDVYREQQVKECAREKSGLESETGDKEKPQETHPNEITKSPEAKEKSVKFPCNQDSASDSNQEDQSDPLPRQLQKVANARLKNDVILCSLIAILVFGIHSSTVFTALQPELSPVLWCVAVILGFILHYVIPQMRKQLPWLCIARPILRSQEHELYQIRGPAKIMWFEKVYVYFSFLERNILYPLLFLSVITEDSPRIMADYGAFAGSFIIVICGIKCLRSSYSNQSSQYLILIFTALCFKYDYVDVLNSFLVSYFFLSIIYHKVYELLLKLQFVVTYIAPWQITWGSAFHAFAQPFSVPHSAMLFLQALVSAILSTPLNPFLGSAIFLTSYVRPVKFWERDYNTRRVDHSNTPLSSHLDRNLGADDNNLNSLFYEHLTRSLQQSLCGDLKLGRWGPVNQGDCFVLASDYLNCLVHIIEMGNNLVTFQMRGLEFRGTYCQQREVEAITEGVEENDGCCCCDAGHLPNMLSVNAAFSQRWLAWEVTAAKYILEGYSISDNSAVSMLQVFEFRKVLVSYYVKSIIFYVIRSPKLEEWLCNQTILKALQPMEHSDFVDLDPVFNYNIDEDFDMQNSGMTHNRFMQIHGEWITYCVERGEKNIDSGINSSLVLLCFALSLLGRRTLGTASHNTVSGVEFFLYGLHALFKGDFRISCARDEWVFTDMDLLKTVVAPGVRMSLKLHQDHFMSPDEYEELATLYDAICKHEEELVISHEGDPAWRRGVLSGTPSLLALRHVLDEGNEEYKIIMLNKRYLNFRVIKINKECVRGLWAGQQQELVYLRNRNPERGSIQNAKQALRNIINSSCDQPIGYPIYVSPLTTSYAETNQQFCSLVGGSITFQKIKNYVMNLFRRIRKRCGEGCSSGSANREEICMGHEGIYAMTPVSTLAHHTSSQSTDGSHLGGSIGRGSSLSRTSLGGNRGSLVSVGKPTSSTLASLAGLFKERDERAVPQAIESHARVDEKLGDTYDMSEKESVAPRVRIVDPNLVYDAINLGRRIDVMWPTEYMRIRGGRSNWKDWVPEAGMEGPIVHKWTPCHKDPNKRSHVDRTILLVQIEDRYVPIAESGVQDLSQEA
ncbi:pecanex isoform X2 [Leptinotarsa decemlineata]|uniref:pecanex isoform X2 n=1 Tax=Leptinotarsa decemlineata TaxID=7539 RepID=UPI003D308834